MSKHLRLIRHHRICHERPPLAGAAVWGYSDKDSKGTEFIPDPRSSRAGMFESCVQLRSVLAEHQSDENMALRLVVMARVDQDWLLRKSSEPVTPDLPPQTHWVNARTNPDWYHANRDSGREVRGRGVFFSTDALVWRLNSGRTLVGRVLRVSDFTFERRLNRLRSSGL